MFRSILRTLTDRSDHRPLVHLFGPGPLRLSVLALDVAVALAPSPDQLTNTAALPVFQPCYLVYGYVPLYMSLEACTHSSILCTIFAMKKSVMCFRSFMLACNIKLRKCIEFHFKQALRYRYSLGCNACILNIDIANMVDNIYDAHVHGQGLSLC